MKAARPKTQHRAKASRDQNIREVATIDGLRQQISKLVADDALEMVSSTIEQVNQGQYQALKYLFEMVGLYPATSAEETPQADSLAKILLSRLGISEEPDPARTTGCEPTRRLDTVE